MKEKEYLRNREKKKKDLEIFSFFCEGGKEKDVRISLGEIGLGSSVKSWPVFKLINEKESVQGTRFEGFCSPNQKLKITLQLSEWNITNNTDNKVTFHPVEPVTVRRAHHKHMTHDRRVNSDGKDLTVQKFTPGLLSLKIHNN